MEKLELLYIKTSSGKREGAVKGEGNGDGLVGYPSFCHIVGGSSLRLFFVVSLIFLLRVGKSRGKYRLAPVTMILEKR